METLPLKVSNFSLAFYRNEPYAAHTCSSGDLPQQLPVHCNCCVLTAAPIRHPRCRHPPKPRLQHQLTLPWHWSPCGRVARNVPTPGKAVTLRDQSMRGQGNGLWHLYCPQNCQLSGLSLFLLQRLHFFPSQPAEKGIDRA